MKYLLLILPIWLFLSLSAVGQDLPHAESCQWTVIQSSDSSLPVARHEAAYVKVGDKHYLIGGRRVQAVSMYDPARGIWTEGAAPPIELHHFQPVVWEGEIWIGGALTGGYPGEDPVSNFYIYSPALDQWRKGPAIPANRLRGSAGTVVYQEKIYLVAGIADGHRGDHKSWLDEFDPATNTWRQLPDAPRPRDHFQASVAEGKLYVIGGRRSHAPDNVFGDTEPLVDVYDFSTQSWMSLDEQLPTPRAGCFNLSVGEEILVIGGESGNTRRAHDEVEALNIHSHSFRSWPSLQQGRHGTGAILHHDLIFIASGNGRRGGGNELTQQECLRPTQVVSEHRLEDLFIRDPYIVPVQEENTYYLYSGTDEPWETPSLRQGVVAYQSQDLETWTGPFPVYQTPADSWADPWYPVWAPEVHRYRGKYYLFATQANPDRPLADHPGRPDQYLRATGISVSDHPLGPFVPVSESPVTPLDWMSLDGTLWVEKGQPWMVFCHEWHQITDGTFELVKLEEDLSATKGRIRTLFSASEGPWSREMTSLGFRVYGWVSDGPWLYRTESGELIMLWSSFGEHRYAIGMARSRSGKIKGPWVQEQEPLFSADGGHSMLFQTFDGKLMLTFHSPNRNPDCRTQLYEVVETEEGLELR